MKNKLESLLIFLALLILSIGLLPYPVFAPSSLTHQGERMIHVPASTDFSKPGGGSGPPAGSVFVAANGSDSAAGTKAAPWQTIAKVNASVIPAGAWVSFRGGDTFSDAVLNPQSGTSGNVTTFTSYGPGQAALSNSDTTITKSVINGTNKSYFMISNLMVLAVSNNGTTGGRNCIFLVNTTSNGSVYAGRYFVSNTIVGAGIGIWLDNQGTDVSSNDYVYGNSISNCAFSGIDWDNDVLGGGTHKGLYHKNPYCARNTIFNIPGNPQFAYACIMGYSTNGVFESNVVHRVGYLSTTNTAGPGGMFPISSSGCHIRYNVVYDIHGNFDAIGLDGDINTTNCDFHHNRVDNCQGPGIINFTQVASDTGNTYYFNIVKNCGSTLKGGVDLYYPCKFYQNTVTAAANPAIITESSGSTIYNNSLTTRGDHVVTYNSGTTEDYNQYWGYVNPVFTFNGTGYASLALYRVGSSQGAHSIMGDANLYDPYRTNLLGSAALITSQVDMEPTTGSVIDQAGANLQSSFGINPGTIDMNGHAIRTPPSMGVIDQVIAPAAPTPEAVWYKFSSAGYTSGAQINNSVFANQSAPLFPQSTTSATGFTPNGYGTLAFGGSDFAFIFAPNAVVNPTTGSISLWFNTSQSSGNNILYSCATITSINGIYIYINGSGVVVGQTADASGNAGNVQSGAGLNDGHWHNLVFCYNQTSGNPLKLYVDTAMVQSNHLTSTWAFTSTENTYLGKAHDTFWNAFVGNMADVRYFTHLVTDAEALQLGTNTFTAVPQ